MSGWLLDTNMLSELRKPRPDPRVVAFIAGQPLESLYVSEVTLAEIRFGIEMQPSAAKRSELNDWLSHRVRPMFERRVLPLNEAVLLRWRLMVEEGRKTGHTFSQPDLFIAASGQHFGLTVVSRDTTEYAKARVSYFNPSVETRKGST